MRVEHTPRPPDSLRKQGQSGTTERDRENVGASTTLDEGETSEERSAGRVVNFKIMMMNRRKNNAVALRYEERRRREGEAPRLHDQVPELVSLRLAIEERSGATATKHIRPVLVDRAPALFVVPCGDSRCIDGEHDLTRTVMAALRAGEKTFQGNDECAGSLGSGQCSRVLHFDALAEYRA